MGMHNNEVSVKESGGSGGGGGGGEILEKRRKTYQKKPHPTKLKEKKIN